MWQLSGKKQSPNSNFQSPYHKIKQGPDQNVFSHIGNCISRNFEPCNRREVKADFIFVQTLLFSVNSPACISYKVVFNTYHYKVNPNLIFIERLERFHRTVKLSTFHFYLLITSWTLVYLRHFLVNTIDIINYVFYWFRS